MVANKAGVKFAQERLGHASALTTLNIYSHAITKQGREYAEAIEAEFPFVSNLLANGVAEKLEVKQPNYKSDGRSSSYAERPWLRGLDLNQRPPGYEPDELPGCSTPRFRYYATCLCSANTQVPDKSAIWR